MKRTIIALLVFAATAFAQWQAIPATQYPLLNQILDAKPAIRYGTVDPTALTCTTGKDLYLRTDTYALWGCVSTNTWQKLGQVIAGAPTTWPSFATVATSGSYNDLSDKPAGGGGAWGSITGTLSAQTDLNTALSGKQSTIAGAPGSWPSFATVATSGSYNDLSDKPSVNGCTKVTIPYTDSIFQASAATVTKTIKALSANEVVTGIRIKHSVAYAGTGITSATISLGDGTTADYYAPAWSIYQAVTAATQWLDGGMASSTAAGHNLVATFTANTLFGSGAATVLTNGSVDIHACTVVLP